MSSTATHWKELARRSGDGVEAALLGDQSLRRVKVMVRDDSLCHHLDFELDGADALSAFSRPFADAASGAIESPRDEGESHE